MDGVDGESFAFHSSVCLTTARELNRGMLNEKVGVFLTNSLKGIVHSNNEKRHYLFTLQHSLYHITIYFLFFFPNCFLGPSTNGAPMNCSLNLFFSH